MVHSLLLESGQTMLANLYTLMVASGAIVIFGLLTGIRWRRRPPRSRRRVR